MTPSHLFGISTQEAAALIAQMTRREREVAEQVALGLRNKEIGKRLGIAVKTVDTFMNKIRLKYGIDRASLPRVWFASKFNGESKCETY